MNFEREKGDIGSLQKERAVFAAFEHGLISIKPFNHAAPNIEYGVRSN